MEYLIHTLLLIGWGINYFQGDKTVATMFLVGMVIVTAVNRQD